MRPLALPLSIVVAAIATGLAGCAPADPTPDPPVIDPSERFATCAESGSLAESVEVDGEFGVAPEVAFDAPFDAAATERTVVLEGDGATVEFGSKVSVQFSVYDGTTGELVSDSGYDPALALPAVADPASLMPGIVATLVCSTEGSRVVGVLAPEDGFGSAGNADLGVAPDTTLVFVLDVLDVVPTQAEGTRQNLADDFPDLGLEFDEDGRPTVVIPAEDPPAELRIGVLIEGTGPIVAETDEFTIHYQGVNWTTGEIFDESWGSAPRTFSSVIPGFRKAIVGQPVGSRVVVIVPPSQGYGAAGNANAGIAGTDTIVFVIDILATAPLG